MILLLEEKRKSKKLSKSKLSQLSGVSRAYISEIESGKYDNPGIKSVCKLCKALDVTPNELINEEYYRG